MDPDLTIVLLGKSGVGKSASGNTILGRAAFKSDFNFTPVTERISDKTGSVFGKQISVVDTPGILDSEEITGDIKIYCQNLLRSNKPCLFLVVLSIGRFTDEDQKAVDTAKWVLGDQGSRKSYMLFTNGDKLKRGTLTDFIFADRESKLVDVVRMFSGAFHLFNNEVGDQEQVRDLLLKTGYLREHQLNPAAALEVQRRMVLLGLPGVGKSSSGNTILGSEKLKSTGGFNSVSTECVSESASVDGRLLQVVDTPGFTDEVLNPEQLYEEIMKTLVEASPGPHVFVIVVRIGKISAADQRLLELVPKLFGGDASKFTMVLFTHGDGLRGRSMDQLIQSNNCVSDLVSMCDGRYCVFDNTQRGRWLQVREFLDKIDEMVAANGGEHCTSDMFRMAETFIREEKNQVAQLTDRNHPDQSGRDTEKPVKNLILEELMSVTMTSGVGLGVICGLTFWMAGIVKHDVVVRCVAYGVTGGLTGGVVGGVVSGLILACGGGGKPDKKSAWNKLIKLILYVTGLGVPAGLAGGVAGGVIGRVAGGVIGRVVGSVAWVLPSAVLLWFLFSQDVSLTVKRLVGQPAGAFAESVARYALFSSIIGFVCGGAKDGMVFGREVGFISGVIDGVLLAVKGVVNAVRKSQSI